LDKTTIIFLSILSRLYFGLTAHSKILKNERKKNEFSPYRRREFVSIIRGCGNRVFAVETGYKAGAW